MSWLPLPIFPEGSLASSVVTTVWVGVVVICFMNLRFGWVFSGLVVPGYLVPLILVKPWAAVVIIVEAMLTLWTVRAVTELMPRFKLACGLFGRDRFLAMIIVSAFYRAIGDTWILPMLGQAITTRFGIAFDYQNNLHSFGLIVICLAANQLWKTGVVKGAIPFAFNTLLTYLLVRYVLMEFTNFSISNFNFLYENIAVSIYAAPKAYIVLITASYLASRMNLLYSWDFNGTMIPALIALQWYEPTKVLTSFVEALVILGGSMLLLKLPWFKSVTMEGARKLLLFFSVSFAYKMALGWGLLFLAPEWKVSDFYGFGYLLPTLMAIKMHQQERILHQLRITAQISMVSVVVANLIGFALTFLPSADIGEAAGHEPVASRRAPVSRLAAVAHQSFVHAHAAVGADPLPAPRPDQLYLFARGLDALDAFTATQADPAWERARQELGAAGFRVDRIGDRYLQVAPVDPASGRPFLLIDRLTDSDLLVECPRALDERDTFDAALALFQDQGARVLAIAGAADALGGAMLGDYGVVRSWFAGIHRSLGRNAAIQVRRAPDGTAPSRLYIKRALPETLNLQQLEDLFGVFDPLWESPPQKNPLRNIHRLRFCELFLSDAALTPSGPAFVIDELTEPIDALIRREISASAPKGTDLYQPPTAAELLHLDRHVLRRLFDLTAVDLNRQLARIRFHAAFYGYAVTAYQTDEQVYVLVNEPIPRRFWGSVVVRIDREAGVTAPLCLQVPSRVGDNSLTSFAATQFKRLQARALITAGTNSRSNSDGSAVLTSFQNLHSFFGLAHQAFARSPQNPAPVVVQVRAFQPAQGEPYPNGDLILAPYLENRTRAEIGAALNPMIRLLERDGMPMTEVGEADLSSPYAAGNNPQAKYLGFVEDSTFALLWLSPFLRENYLLTDADNPVCKGLRSVGIAVREEPLSLYLSGTPFVSRPATQHALKQRLRTFRQSGSIHSLGQLAATFPGETFEGILDSHTRRLFLACLDPQGQPRLVANLSSGAVERSLNPATSAPEAFADACAAWLEQDPPNLP